MHPWWFSMVTTDWLIICNFCLCSDVNLYMGTPEVWPQTTGVLLRILPLHLQKLSWRRFPLAIEICCIEIGNHRSPLYWDVGISCDNMSTQDMVSAQWSLNTDYSKTTMCWSLPSVTRLLYTASWWCIIVVWRTFQEGATKILHSHLRSSSQESEPLSPRNITSPPAGHGGNRYKPSPNRYGPLLPWLRDS